MLLLLKSITNYVQNVLDSFPGISTANVTCVGRNKFIENKGGNNLSMQVIDFCLKSENELVLFVKVKMFSHFKN